MPGMNLYAVGRRLLPVFFLAVVCAFTPTQTSANESHEEFNLDRERLDKDNLFNLIFGSAPAMPTERGTLIIDAFHDRNGNGRRDAEDSDLEQEIVCRLDEVDYLVPAFIPGLTLDGIYVVDCSGERFRLDEPQRDVFIRKRGEIIHLDLACRRSPHDSSNSRQPSISGK